MVFYSLCCIGLRKIEGSQATAKQTAELLRQVVSQQRMPYTNQASVLIDAVRAVGEQLIAANPIGELSNSYFSCFPQFVLVV